jgi:hypothetical protein
MLRGQNTDRDEGRLSGGLRQAAAQRRLQEGPIRQPARPAREEAAARALNEPVYATINGRRRKIIK